MNKVNLASKISGNETGNDSEQILLNNTRSIKNFIFLGSIITNDCDGTKTKVRYCQ